jgi:hypothetical protein
MRGLKAEHQFWEGVVKTSNPGWNVKLQPDWKERNSLEELVVYSYILDVSNGWTVVGGFGLDIFERVYALYREVKPSHMKRHLDQIHNTLLAASDANVQAGSQEAVNACVLSMVSWCNAKTFEAARQASPRLEGHWISVLYRLKDGACLRRPAFVQKDGFPAAIDPGSLCAMVEQIIRTDRNPKSNVGQQIRAGGGANIHPKFLS